MTAWASLSSVAENLNSNFTLVKERSPDCEPFWQDALKCLKEITDIFKTSAKRALGHNEWRDMENLVHLLTTLDESVFKKFGIEMEVCAEVFRCLRNACARCPENQDAIVQSETLFPDTVKLFALMKGMTDVCKNEEGIVCIRCALQYFGNFICGNTKGKVLVWTEFFREADYFLEMLSHEDIKVSDYASMVLCNCLTCEHVTELASTEKGQTVVNALLNLIVEGTSEWSIWALEKITDEGKFYTDCYPILETEMRILILDALLDRLKPGEGEAVSPVESKAVEGICQLFKDRVLDILKSYSEAPSNDLEALEISKFLDILAFTSYQEEYADILKEDQALLECSIDALKSVHMLGKSGSNAFTPIQNLKMLAGKDKDELQAHPAYGFKRDLIRLIGNLCYKHSINQAIVRKNEGIPLLLDCCNLDARNPYIMQWCILCIRNLTENNSENQEVLGTLARTGVLVDSPLLKELGLVIEEKDGRVSVRSVAPERKADTPNPPSGSSGTD